MRIMAIDYGNKRLGIALSDEMSILAARSWTLKRAGAPQEDIEAIRAIVSEEDVERIVMGMPLNLRRGPSEMADKVTEFGKILTGELKIRVEYWDERFTSRMAEKILLDANMSRGKRKKVKDGMAAALILQNYLDRKNISR